MTDTEARDEAAEKYVEHRLPESRYLITERHYATYGFVSGWDACSERDAERIADLESLANAYLEGADEWEESFHQAKALEKAAIQKWKRQEERIKKLEIALKLVLCSTSMLIGQDEHDWRTCDQPSCTFARTVLDEKP